MKIEQVLVHYLIKTRQLPLQGIGTFHLDASIPDTSDPEKPIVIPENAISFTYDPRTPEDEGLVDFIVEHTKKIKPLAASDLDSFLSLGRQFLNIGKPLNLPHIGTLEKLNSGVLAFVPGAMIAPRMEPNRIKNDNEHQGPESEDNSLFHDYQKERKSNNAGKTILALLVLIILGFAVWAVWHYAFTTREPTETVTSTEGVVPVKDSAFKTDSATIANAQPVISTSDTVSFDVVVNEYSSLRLAEQRLQKLTKYHRNVILYTDDSSTFKIAEPFRLPLSDTGRILDSLRRYYAKTVLEIK